MKDKKLLYIIVGAVIVAGVLVWMRKNSDPVVGDNDPLPTSGSGPKTSGAAMPQTYTQALARYEGNRFQFDAMCQTKPTTASYKNGATIMLDNRSGDARTVKIGGVRYNLPGYGWRIVTLSSAKLPATLDIDCGGAQNVSIITLYK